MYTTVTTPRPHTARRVADDAYTFHRAAALELLEQVRMGIHRHSAAQADNRTHWGYVGDMEHVAEALQAVVLNLPAEPNVPDVVGLLNAPRRMHDWQPVNASEQECGACDARRAIPDECFDHETVADCYAAGHGGGECPSPEGLA